ncbi:MAG TPA: ribonuclease P protein component [Acidimicrobiales bacterium]
MPSTVLRIRDRATFEAMRRAGTRARRGPITVVRLPVEDDSLPPRVAYAIGRKTGGAVVRNRLRRRLRAIAAELAGDAVTPLPGGAYLLVGGLEAANLPFAELRAAVADAVSAVVARQPA